MADSGGKHPHDLEQTLHRHLGEVIESAAGKLRERLHTSLTSMLQDALHRPEHRPQAPLPAGDPWVDWLTALLGASEPEQALHALLDSVADMARRAAVFVVRGEYAICWQTSGMQTTDPVSLSGNSALANALRTAAVVQWGPRRELPLAPLGANRAAGEFSADGGASLGGMYPITVRGKAIAALHWDAEAGHDIEAEKRVWLLVQITGFVLERLLGAAPRLAAASAAVERAAAPAVAARGAGTAAASHMTSRTQSPAGHVSEAERRARRYAKVLVEDLQLYVERDHPGSLDQGRKNRDLYSRLRNDLDKARKSFAERFPVGSGVRPEILDEEIIRILAQGNAAVMGSGFQVNGAGAQPVSSAAPQVEARARRYAKVLIEDLELYLERDRPDQLSAGRQNRDLYRRLRSDIDKCRQSFKEKFPANTGVSTYLLEQELVRVLCKGDRSALGGDYAGM